MPGSLLPPPFHEIGQRRFSFYPPIAGAEPNEWLLRTATWSEALVVNARTQQELWISRRYIGSVSETDDPVLIVGLTKELEYRNNAVLPRVRRVIEMPRAANDLPVRPWVVASRAGHPAPVIGIRLEKKTGSKALRVLGYAGVAAVVLSLLTLVVFRDWFQASRMRHRHPTTGMPARH